MEKEKRLARERASIILQVGSGVLTVTEGAERLGISRKTYYEWEERALAAMAETLENHPPGRPSVPLDAEKEELQRRVRDLEKKLDLAEKTIEVKDILSAYEAFRAGGGKKNSGKKQKDGKRQSAE